MPTDREREYYRMGFQDGQRADSPKPKETAYGVKGIGGTFRVKTKRKLSAWNKFVKVNSKKPRFRYKSGAKRGKVNLKALGIAYRKKKR